MHFFFNIKKLFFINWLCQNVHVDFPYATFKVWVFPRNHNTKVIKPCSSLFKTIIASCFSATHFDFEIQKLGNWADDPW